MKCAKMVGTTLILVIFAWACKKNESTDNTSTGLDPADAVALTQNIKVNHGQKIEGVMPVPSGNGVALATASNNKSSYAIAGKFAVIKPQISVGEVAGYYLHIVGDNKSHFKVDFSKPVSGRKKMHLPNSRRIGISKKVTDDNPDYTDSVIIIRLPDNIKPGTFCVEYSAYDWNGGISNVIKECITVTPLGGDKNLVGKWGLTKSKDDNEDWIYYPDTAWFIVGDYKCVNNQLIPAEPADSNAALVRNVPVYGYRYNYSDWTFSEDGSGQEEYDEIELDLNLLKSSCDKFVYDSTVDVWQSQYIWSLDTAAHKLIIIDEGDPNDIVVIESTFQYIDKDHFSIYIVSEDEQKPGEFYETWAEFARK